MIKEIHLQNFKSHKNTKISLNNLTVFCGQNGVGKSSVIQSLLLLRDNYLKDKSFNNLDLKSKSVKIGTANDVIYEFSETDGFTINIEDESIKSSFVFEAITEDSKVKTFIPLNTNKSIINDKIDDLNLFSCNFQYISAFRLGPQEQYLKDDKSVDIYRQISDLNGQAEYFVHFLERYRDEDVLPYIAHQSELFIDLFSQVVAWENEISEGINIQIQDLGKLGFTLKYSFDSNRGASKKTRDFEAVNVGFGISYVMPILVAILSTKKGGLIIIENPEAHLHPNGISKLTELICLAAEAGIQIIIETHSDHVINGILVQAKKFEVGNKGINKNNVGIFHFDRNNDDHSTIPTEVVIESDGKIRNPPKGFFDQFTIDRRFLMGF